jgi:ParB-like chromosome segregation protein Spo0J
MAKQRLDLSHIAEPLRPLAAPMADLNLDPRNARKHGEENITAIAASLGAFGQRRPIVVNRKNNQIEAGNGTYLAAQQLGWTHLAVVWVEDDAKTQRGFSIADNRTAELAKWDRKMLDDLLLEVADETPDLYDAFALHDLFRGNLSDTADTADGSAGTDETADAAAVPSEDGEATDAAGDNAASGEHLPAPDQPVEAEWKIVINCRDEAQQRELYERFEREGLSCRLLTI